ncbi:saccharopine dehydrogenase-like oxidoreductase [Methylophaga frappieri]|uniref:Saccharopine dehydrogenase-like oxidoreductase n=2 Tax=Methylophaga frappieri (strain ATCC BAA-2434 / DSM 25690 / JAM7) TaxID=754477 RepID=I1YF79_METFJ|nr:saccharopine dehydrogenase-like oxidoreductase [Methylophaga frappieri]
MEAATHLLKNTTANLTLASRTIRAIPSALQSRFGDRIATLQLDVNDEKTLIAACHQADVMISCIGPSGIVGDTVAQVCKKTQTPLVDAGGYDPVWHRLEQAEAITASTIPLIINVGLLPGLSGMFPKYVIDATAQGRKVKQLDVQYVGRDAWSYNSAWDIINGLGDFGNEKGFCFIHRHQMVKVPMRKATNKAHFPDPIGRVSTMLLYAEEITRLAKQYDIETARVFGANIGPRATFVALIAKVFRLYQSRKGIDRAAKWMAKASKKDMRKLAPAYGIQVDITYESGHPVTAQLMLADTYQATGAIMAIATRAVLDGKTAGPGVYSLHEAMTSQRFMQDLEASGLLTFNTAKSIENK